MVEKRFKQLLLCVGLLGQLACHESQVSQSKADNKTLPDFVEERLGPKDVIVQLFNWPFSKITDEMPRLKEMGYGQIHVSPPNLTVESDMWWGRYQPVDYRLIAGPLGSEAQFQKMLEVAHRNGIRIIVDIVFNHTANESFSIPKEAKELANEKGPLFAASDYNSAFCISDYNDSWQVRNGRLCGGNGDTGLPDLNQNSSNVLKVQREFLSRLVKMGVDGFRFDAIKHMEPEYFDRLLAGGIVEGKFIFGEVIADSSTYDRDLEPYISKMGLYDFPLRKSLQDALSLNGKMSELEPLRLEHSKNALPWNKSVAFIINHDIPNNAGFRSWILDEKSEELAYAYILGRSQGVPYVYSDLGTKGGAGLIDDRWDHAHRSEALGKMVAFHNYVHGEAEAMLSADQCTFVMKRGSKGLLAINKCAEERTVFVGQVFADDSAYDLVERKDIKMDDKIKIPARSYRLILHR